MYHLSHVKGGLRNARVTIPYVLIHTASDNVVNANICLVKNVIDGKNPTKLMSNGD